MAQVIWSDPAAQDFDRIVNAIAMENPLAAKRWAVKLSDTVDKLHFFPEMGRPILDLPGKLFRELLVSPCRVIYGFDGGSVRILHVFRYEQQIDFQGILGSISEPEEPYLPIPAFESEAQERAFWESHDSTEYVDWSNSVRGVFPNLKPSTQTPATS